MPACPVIKAPGVTTWVGHAGGLALLGVVLLAGTYVAVLRGNLALLGTQSRKPHYTGNHRPSAWDREN